ncbi:MAG: glycosyltransferase family protein, partial [Acholeplasma sp.]|nr:glycosyltransferase family protein [Acholeplasma sp.]
MIYAIIQARMGSARLPNKIFMEFCKKPNLYHVYNRVHRSKKIDKVIIATTVQREDDRVYEFCKKNGIDCFRGSQDDVLDRYYQCCLDLKALPEDSIVRITADCPLIDSSIIDDVIDFYKNNNYDYASNTYEPTFPDGLDLEVFSFQSLKKAWEEANLLSEREHVTPYIKKNSEIFKIGSYKNNKNLSHLRWTLDEIEDYQLISIIYENLYNEEGVFATKEILAFLSTNPELNKINDK